MLIRSDRESRFGNPVRSRRLAKANLAAILLSVEFGELDVHSLDLDASRSACRSARARPS